MSKAKTPRVSILIPNFNNGRGSSLNGEDDQIGNLLESLEQTLGADPTPFEIIVYDDGSTDDSLATLRAWSGRRWSDGRPFLELIEAEHCGVLAKTANVLSRRAQGEYLARLDGDTVCLTPDWVSRLCEVFDSGSDRLGVVGPKQLGPNGRILSYGDWVLHPSGYTHIGLGMVRDAARYPLQVDHVMGCFYCCKKRLFEELGGYDEDFLRGQTVDFGLRARLAGWYCMVVPHMEFIHMHTRRVRRDTRADSDEGVLFSMDIFKRKWGFHRVAPDLDDVRRLYGGTPLLWSRWCSAAPAKVGEDRPVRIEDSDWVRFAEDASFRKRIEWQMEIVAKVIRQMGMPRLVVQVGCGVGLLLHLLATQGVSCMGLDESGSKISLARQCVAGRSYPSGPPRYERIENRRLPLEKGEADLVLMFDQMEVDANPVGLLREAARVTEAGCWWRI